MYREGNTMKKNVTNLTLWKCIHWLIILHFLGEIIYCAYIVFSVLQPDTGAGPLMDRANTIPFEQMVTRRLYAIECWVATAGLAIYLAITELAPRFGSFSNSLNRNEP